MPDTVPSGIKRTGSDHGAIEPLKLTYEGKDVSKNERPLASSKRIAMSPAPVTLGGSRAQRTASGDDGAMTPMKWSYRPFCPSE